MKSTWIRNRAVLSVSMMMIPSSLYGNSVVGTPIWSQVHTLWMLPVYGSICMIEVESVVLPKTWQMHVQQLL